MSACFAPLLRGVRKDWPNAQVASALDASPWGQRLTVWCLRVVERGSAVPVAWKMVAATAPSTCCFS
jgi:hypothetical protein